MEGMGEEKLYFLLLKLVKCKNPVLGQVSQLILSPIVDVVVNFLSRLIFIFPLFWGMVMYVNEF